MVPEVRRRGPFSSLTGRILAVNVLALVILVGGLLYHGKYRESLLRAEIDALATQGEVFAAALGEGAVASPPGMRPFLVPALARQMIRRLVAPTRARARLFNIDGSLIGDSWALGGTAGLVQVEELPSPGIGGTITAFVERTYDRVQKWFSAGRGLPPYHERLGQTATDYKEVIAAFRGNEGRAIRVLDDGELVLSVAVPVQRYKQVVGVVMLSTTSAKIDEALRRVRVDILQMFLIVLAITVLLSIFLAGTIARPVHRLAAAAVEVAHGHGRKATIPNFSERGDEIGDLSEALHAMTAALWQRMDAIEGFAADVAHEIKNPLTSLRSAVETASRVKDPERQRRLMAIILEDVQRLDRLISDISEASRLDAELSRAELAPVDVGGLLATLADMVGGAAGPKGPRVALDLPEDTPLEVPGMEGRLAQIFRNLLENAISFSPPDGVIHCRARRTGSFVTVTIEDAGPGLPEGKLEAIFDRFYTERPAGEKFGTHSGLGLAIARQIVQAHGGTISAENRRDAAGEVCGARFTVRLPVR